MEEITQGFTVVPSFVGMKQVSTNRGMTGLILRTTLAAALL